MKAYTRSMEDIPHPSFAAGFPEMWQPVYDKYKLFFDCAEKLAPIVSEMIQTPVQGMLLQMVGQMTAAAANTHGALLTLVLNGYGHDAMKLARSLFEIELNILRLKAHPDEIADFVDYSVIQQKQLYDMLDDDQKKQQPQRRYDEMMAEYNSVLPPLQRAEIKHALVMNGAGSRCMREQKKPAKGIWTSTGHFIGMPPPCITWISAVSVLTWTKTCMPIWLLRGNISKTPSSLQAAFYAASATSMRWPSLDLKSALRMAQMGITQQP
jgi:Family of unknown function (DUF5677)